jgi:hypothetical protein
MQLEKDHIYWLSFKEVISFGGDNVSIVAEEDTMGNVMLSLPAEVAEYAMKDYRINCGRIWLKLISHNGVSAVEYGHVMPTLRYATYNGERFFFRTFRHDDRHLGWVIDECGLEALKEPYLRGELALTDVEKLDELPVEEHDKRVYANTGWNHSDMPTDTGFFVVKDWPDLHQQRY